jgi:hypothetical protein
MLIRHRNPSLSGPEMMAFGQLIALGKDRGMIVEKYPTTLFADRNERMLLT